VQRHQPPSELFQVHIPVVEDAGVETVLTNVASGALGGIAVGGVLAIQVHHEERDGIGPVADGDQMKVMGHQGNAATRTWRSSLSVPTRLRK